jgi:hypothetical protein
MHRAGILMTVRDGANGMEQYPRFLNADAWISTITGIGLLGLVVLDIFRTILHSRGRSGPVTEALTRAVWRLVRGVAFRRSRLGLHRLLNHVSPLLLPGIVATLVALHPRVCASLLAASARRLQRPGESAKLERHRGPLFQWYHLHHLGLR